MGIQIYIITMKSVEEKAQSCLEEILKTGSLQIKDLKRIIEQYIVILPPPLEKLKDQQLDIKLQGTNQLFIPSLDLMRTYQSTYVRTVDKDNPQSISVGKANTKLQRLYSGTNQIQTNTFQQNKSNSYQPNYITLEHREQNLLEGIRKGTIEATLPLIEQSLQINEIENLQKKSVYMQNNVTLKQLKQMRKKLQQNLQN